MVFQPVIRIEADGNVLSRKVVRDSIRGISESQRVPDDDKSTADGYHYSSQGGHSVCMVVSAA